MGGYNQVRKYSQKRGIKSGNNALDNCWFYHIRICCARFHEEKYGE